MSPERRELLSSDLDRGFRIATQVSEAADLIKTYADTADDLELAEFAHQFATELRTECMLRDRAQLLATDKPRMSWAEFSARHRVGTSTQR
ncbi:hypothetical protein [Nocardia cerradoensis]|uniref:Uncharacterized protein n=1 Tax=Nocardia cerradoensis TaxID=85688 RepID=A0A231GSY3_9NOCA|nr:hypothetical protein [Nocardia cerradoensis]NKY43611.1 hypothetical protein [Nocardia cerradoensis]OXR39730.1 hypothetical protein B7C42_08200 [Nocardia cerradoensis]